VVEHAFFEIIAFTAVKAVLPFLIATILALALPGVGIVFKKGKPLRSPK
jgi:hypothetical protein